LKLHTLILNRSSGEDLFYVQIRVVEALKADDLRLMDWRVWKFLRLSKNPNWAGIATRNKIKKK
jgi:hypothetical protein